MSAADRVIRWSTAMAVLGVAAVAAVPSYEHAYDLVRAHGEAGWTARLVAADGGRADLRKFEGDARLRAPQGAGSRASAVAPGRRDRGDGPRSRWSARTSSSWRWFVVPGSRRTPRPRPGAKVIRCRRGRRSCSPGSSRRTGFPRCAPNSTSDNPGHKGCEPTSPTEQQGRYTPAVQLRFASLGLF